MEASSAGTAPDAENQISPDLIEWADVIFVIQDGKVVESGTHDELCAAGGLYSELYEIQFGALK